MSALLKLRLAKGLTQKQLADMVGTTAVQIGRLERWPVGRDARKLTVEWANRLAPQLGCSPAELLEEGIDDKGTAKSTAGPAMAFLRIPVRGNVAAGTWFDDGLFDPQNQSIEVYVPTEGYHGEEKAAYRVMGNSVDQLGIVDGSYVVTVPYDHVRNGIRTNDVVVVERRRHSQVERTVKQVVVEDDVYRLEPRSSDARHQPIVIPRGPVPVADDTEIEIVGLVIGSYRPFV